MSNEEHFDHQNYFRSDLSIQHRYVTKCCMLLICEHSHFILWCEIENIYSQHIPSLAVVVCVFGANYLGNPDSALIIRFFFLDTAVGHAQVRQLLHTNVWDKQPCCLLCFKWMEHSHIQKHRAWIISINGDGFLIGDKSEDLANSIICQLFYIPW